MVILYFEGKREKIVVRELSHWKVEIWLPMEELKDWKNLQ